MKAAQFALNTVKTIRRIMENCNRDYEAVARSKEHSRRSDCLRTPGFLQQLQAKVMEDRGKGFLVMAREMVVTISTMKMALYANLRYQAYKSYEG